VVSGVRRMNEVNARRARVGDRLRAGIPSRYVTISQPNEMNKVESTHSRSHRPLRLIYADYLF